MAIAGDTPTILSFERPVEETLRGLIRRLNSNEYNDPSKPYQKIERQSVLIELSGEVASSITDGLSKEQIYNQLSSLGLKAEFFDEVYDLATDIYASHQESYIKDNLLSLMLNGDKEEQAYVSSLIKIARSILIEGKSEQETLAKLQSEAEVDEQTASAILEFVEEADYEKVPTDSSTIASIKIVIFGVVIATILFFFVRL